jgi:hypothetical protein
MRDAAHAIEQAIFGVDVKVGKLPWHQLNYNICAEGPKRGISNCQKFLHHHSEHRYLPVLLLKLSLGFEAGMIMINKNRLRPKAWVVGSGFVVHLERRKVYGF